MRGKIVKAAFGSLAAVGFGSLVGMAACADSADDCALIGTCRPGGGTAIAQPTFATCVQRRYGDAQDQGALGVAVEPNTGTTFVLGSFSGTLKIGASPLSATTQEMFVAAFDKSLSQVRSAKQFPVTYLDSAPDPTPGGGVIIVGTKTGDVDFGCPPLPADLDLFIVRLTPKGLCTGSAAFAVTATSARVAVDAAGNVALAGSFTGSADFGGVTPPFASVGGHDMFVSLHDATTLESGWSSGFGTVNDDFAGGVDFDAAGDVVLAGSFAGSLDLGDGSNPLDSEGAGADVLLVHLAQADGHLQSHEHFSSPGDQIVFDLATSPDNSVTIAGGMVGGGPDFGDGPLSATDGIFLARLGPKGKYLFSKGFAVAAGEAAGLGSLAVEPGTGRVALAGLLAGSIDFGGGSLSSTGEDAFMALFDKNGAHVTSKLFGAADAQRAYGVAFSSGDLVLGGAFAGTLTLGEPPLEPLQSGGGSDIFVAKLSESCPAP